MPKPSLPWLYMIRTVSCLFAICFALMQLAARPSQEQILTNARAIDSFIEDGLKESGAKRNDSITDTYFARRIYLDIGGRIPTYDELNQFIIEENPNKRGALISDLLQSEAYVSNFYNYWEDVLRVQSRKRRSIMISYQDWIKNALRSNMPFDDFATNLVTPDGYVWDNGAAGYYLRDAGMPLDNMSNTAQVFLGTRMQCAQCHDHPFDTWTQKEYYHMAAYTFSVESSGTGYKDNEAFQAFRKVAAQAFREENGITGRRGGNFQKGYSPAQRRAVRDIFQPVSTRVQEIDRELSLPDDYQYDNAKPNQKMAPAVPFGEDAKPSRNESPREAYATWLTSPNNPRFPSVIANRLWKKAFGIGLFEPVDNLKDDTVSSNPALLEFLSEMIIDYGFDMKAYLETIFNTTTYQSATTPKSTDADEKYLFPGPTLRRMSAEQLWDSIMTLTIPNIDNPSGGDIQTKNLRERETKMKEQVEIVNTLNGQQLYSIIKYVGNVESKFIGLEDQLKAKLDAAPKEEKRAINKEIRNLRKQKNLILEKALQAASGKTDASSPSMANNIPSSKSKMQKSKKEDYMQTLVRASDVISPAPAGHFLRQFGQSDREIIQNSSDEAAIPQALSLLNGPAINWIQNRQSTFSKTIQEAENLEDKQEAVFMSFLGRTSTEAERAIFEDQIEKHGLPKALKNMTTALLNSQEFRFIQ